MSFQVERRFSLLILEEGEEYVADVSASMALERKGKPSADSKGRLRIGSKSLIFQPDEISASILKFPFRHVRSVGDAERGTSRFSVESEQLIQVATKTGTETRIVTPFSVLRSKWTVNFHVLYAGVDEYRQLIYRLWESSTNGKSETEAVVRNIINEVTADVQFDVSRLGHREVAQLQGHLWVRRVKPLLEVRGMLQVSDDAVYFQPHPNFSSKPVTRVALKDVLHVFRRTYGVQANALEIITVQNNCLYLCFEAQNECNHVAEILQRRRQALTVPTGGVVVQSSAFVNPPGSAEEVLFDIRKITALWQSGLLSNFHYLDFLNCAAGRSQNDFSQYPVFPWVLQDYSSESLNLDDPAVYRDLSKPVGALSRKRLDYFRERMRGMSEEERFLYGTHYSTPAYVIYWLLRSMPERMLRLHNGHFDAMQRLFRSVKESWVSVNESTASLMELIPEFFVYPAEWLENSLGIVTAEGPLTDVSLPRWATDVSDFVCKMRAALESEHVSRNLPAWIDLIFGYKQDGEEAVLADNLFHPVCYTGSRGSQSASSSDLPISVLETQLQEFGRVPRQLFNEAHPPRLKIQRWDQACLSDDPRHSEPWYKAVQHLSAGAADDAMASSVEVPNSSMSNIAASSPQLVNGMAIAQDVVGSCTTATMRALIPQAAPTFAASGQITGVAACGVNTYSIGEDGCLRVGPLPVRQTASDLENATSRSTSSSSSMRRNFRISPMPLCALVALRTDLIAIGGHDNAVTLYSSSCGSAIAKGQVHADTVTCLGISQCRTTMASGSRDQSVTTWVVTPTSLKSEETFDDVQQPIACVAAATNLILAGAIDGQLMAWDRRSGRPVLDRVLGGPAVACALHHEERFAIALDEAGEVRLWDLRRGCESLRLSVLARAGSGSLARANCFLTDFEGWAVLGGANAHGRPAVALWDIPEQRELHTWTLHGTDDVAEVRFLVQPTTSPEDSSGDASTASFLCASATGVVHSFLPRDAT